MAEALCLAEVRLWGRTVGAVYEPPDGRPLVFEYDEGFRRSGLEISPVMLPLRAGGPRSFPELMRVGAFAGLPGVLADALPDRFGNAVIRKFFAEQGKPDAALSPVQKLLYVGERAMGALTFHPALDVEPNVSEAEALEVAALVAAARRIVEGATDVAVPEIMQLGASAGGARAKAVVLWNRARGEMRSAFAERQDGDEDWMIKFDGVGELDHPNPEPQPYNRIEVAYAAMARAAGIDMAKTRLVEERGLGHFMTKRFDRDGERRLHMHTLGGMEHADYNMPGAFSYEQYLRVVLRLELGYPALEQAYRRAVFNVLAVNQDDHVKNFAFLMDEAGRWRLAPAYDLTFACGRGYTARHQLSLAGKRDALTTADLVEVGAKFGIRKNGRDVIGDVAAALENWPAHARNASVPAADIARISKFSCRL